MAVLNFEMSALGTPSGDLGVAADTPGRCSRTVKIECGGMCERLKQAVLKTAVPERVPGVRIPLPPPVRINFYTYRFLSLLNADYRGGRFALEVPASSSNLHSK